jgi:hypothetical protein
MIRRRKYPNLLTTLGIDVADIEWRTPTVSKHVMKQLRARAAAMAKVIADDWMQAARARLEAVGRQIAADALDQGRRDKADAERLAAERDLADTLKVIDRLVEQELPKVRAELDMKRKQRHKLNRALKREQQKLQSEQLRLARLKLARLRRR